MGKEKMVNGSVIAGLMGMKGKWTVEDMAKALGMTKLEEMLKPTVGRIPQVVADCEVSFNMSLKTTLGQFKGKKMGSYRVGRIEFNSALLNDAGSMKDTLLHEVAHAWAWAEYNLKGHGRTWVRLARALGHNGERCVTVREAASLGVVRKNLPKYLVARCERCRVGIRRARRLPFGKTFTHRGCGGDIVRVGT